MAPQRHVDIVVLRLNYVEKFSSLKRPTIRYMRRESKPEIDVQQVSYWFDDVMRHEIYNLPRGMKRHFVEWRKVSNNFKMFRINGVRYDQILIIMGESYVWWVFYQYFPQTQFVTGKGNFPISYCSCCFHRQYLKIVNQVLELQYKSLTNSNSNSRHLRN